MGIEQRFNSLEDFLASTELSVDGTVDDGWGFNFPLKGREIEATVMFADISGFSTRTLGMSPVATLAYVQNFFAWVTAEALHGRPGIVDKYIGDEVMVVFSKEFGSEDPFADAVRAGARMSENDVHSYCPHIGIASGRVIVGYAGTPLRYNVSVFGAPVALAARLAGIRPPEDVFASSSVVVTSEEWGERELNEVLPPLIRKDADGNEYAPLQKFELQSERAEVLKGVGEVKVREIYNTGLWMPTLNAEDRAIDNVYALHRQGRYWPRWDDPKPSESRLREAAEAAAAAEKATE